MEESVLLLDGFDDAFIGYARRINEPVLAIYSYDRIVDILINRDGMSADEAVEYTDFNIVGVWVGNQTPMIMFSIEE